MALLAAHSPGWCWWRLAVLVLLALLGTEVSAQAKVQANVQDYQVEAVYLFNFTQFVEWPSAAFADEQKPIVIGVLGDDPFGPYLDETVRGEIVGNRPLIVRRYRRIEDVEVCQVLFISRSEVEHLEAILGRLKDRSILTVSDADGFTQRGGIVRFVTQNDHVKLRINVEAAKAAGLTISSKLLRVADTVSAEMD
jgi:YfiR/HmsC-like